VVGAGSAGLMAAEVMASDGAAVTVYDHMPSIGRKLLMAGRGGLNLTHAEPFDTFLDRYRGLPPPLEAALRAWPPSALRAWCEGLGQETFVGSSGRVFPVAMKASPLLRAWRARLDALGVAFRLRHRWTGWTDAAGLAFETPSGSAVASPDAVVLALGGASWPRLGSDGAWVEPLAAAGVGLAPFRPANCGFDVPWSAPFLARHEGQPLKSVALRFGADQSRGDVVVTARGLEGGALYALAASLRDALEARGEAVLTIALRPDLSHAEIVARLARRRPKDSLASSLKRTLRLAPVALGLLREGEPALATFDADALAQRINAIPVRLCGTAPLARAISTAGGVRFDAVDGSLMLRDRPGAFVAGEMLDWEAPTGGYLLQASFATGAAAGHSALAWCRINRN
jgi:uncharacterized flavoprotein (TIGR03862 family)